MCEREKEGGGEEREREIETKKPQCNEHNNVALSFVSIN